jgi:hypothetical protein
MHLIRISYSFFAFPRRPVAPLTWFWSFEEYTQKPLQKCKAKETKAFEPILLYIFYFSLLPLKNALNAFFIYIGGLETFVSFTWNDINTLGRNLPSLCFHLYRSVGFASFTFCQTGNKAVQIICFPFFHLPSLCFRIKFDTVLTPGRVEATQTTHFDSGCARPR